MTRHPQRPGIRLRSLFLWHRYLGLSAAIFVVFLGITGIMLNHTEGLRLDERFVTSKALLDWYGIKPPLDRVSFQAGDDWVTQLGDVIYLNNRQLIDSHNRLLGFLDLGDFMVVAVEQELLLLSEAGEVIEHLKGIHGVPAGMQAIGLDASGHLVARGNHGNYVVDEDFLEWRAAESSEIQWSQPAVLPRTLYEQVAELYRSTDLTLERIVLDVHSGRIIGSWGIYVMDGAALLLLCLAVTGVLHWSRRKRR